MLLIIGTVRLRPENRDAALPVMAKMVVASRAEDGCLGYAYAEDVLEPGLIHVIERWRDEADLRAHFASDHIVEWRAAWPALGISDRQLHSFESDGGSPC